MTNLTGESAGERPSRSAWGFLGFLTLVNVLNFVDRTLIGSLGPLLIADLGLSRAQIGLLVGFAFVAFYSLVGLALGLVADRWRRIPLVALGLGLWSAMTAVSGAARSFVQLALPRLFVGAGEATLTPSALSMLADRFPPRRLATASGIYYAGIPLGRAVGLIASSYLAPRYGWRVCFYLLGGLGLLAVPVLLAFREPPRHAGGAHAPRFSTLIAELAAALRSRRELGLVLLGGALLCFGTAAANLCVTWLVAERGFPFAEAAFSSGLVAIAAGLTGSLAGGAFADWCASRWSNGRLRALGLLTLVFVVASPLFYALPARTPLFYLAWFLSIAGGAAWFGPFFVALQELSPAATRASAISLGLLSVNLLGVGPGPLVAGMIGDAKSLTAGLLVSVAVAATALVPFALAARGGRFARNVAAPGRS